MQVAVNIVLETKARQLLERLSRSRSTPARLAERSRIVLLASAGKENGGIAAEMGITRQKAGRWRDRYHRFGSVGIKKDAARPGRKKTISSRQVNKVIKLTTQEKPKNAIVLSCDDKSQMQALDRTRMSRIEIVAPAASHAVDLSAALAKCRRTRNCPGCTSPPLAHRAACVRARGPVDKAWRSPEVVALETLNKIGSRVST